MNRHSLTLSLINFIKSLNLGIGVGLISDNKKEQERQELHRTIWAIANDLRGSVDGWDFKNYVLGALFYRYISENLCAFINQIQKESGESDFDYSEMKDEEAEEAHDYIVNAKGYWCKS